MVGIGGALGINCALLGGHLYWQQMGRSLPLRDPAYQHYGFLLVGLLLAVLGAKAHWSPYWRYLVPIGFLGGYATFSNFEHETLRMFQDGQIGLGLLYVAASVVVGFAAVWGGVIAGRAIP